MKLKLKDVAAEDYATLTKAAKQEGFESVEAWLTYHSEKFVQTRLRGGLDLPPKEARKQLNLGQWAFQKLMHQGAFPNLYKINARVVRIPQADIDRYKARRVQMIAAA